MLMVVSITLWRTALSGGGPSQPLVNVSRTGKCAQRQYSHVHDTCFSSIVNLHHPDEYYEYKAGCDETYALNINATERLLDMAPEVFAQSSAQLATLHFSAAQQLIPRLQPAPNGEPPSYTFVTGDGSGKPGGDRTAMGEINSHHVWGLSAALRRDLDGQTVVCREIRVGLPVHTEDPRRGGNRPLSEDIGNLCAGLATLSTKEDHGRLIRLEEFDQLNDVLNEYKYSEDGKELPHYTCDTA